MRVMDCAVRRVVDVVPVTVTTSMGLATMVIGCLLVIMTSSPMVAAADTALYTAHNDATWAVMSNQLATPEKQAEYDAFMDACRASAGDRADIYCDKDEAFRLQMNSNQPQSVRNYTETGFLKIKAPDAVFQLVHQFWEQNKDSAIVEWKHPSSYHNTWDAPPTIIRVDNSSLIGGGPQLYAAIANAARDAMEAWTGLPQSSTSVYGIRTYHNQSILAPHVDRLPLVSSAIINVAQDVEEDWYLEVYDHQGVAHNVTMEPGDLVLYESHSVIHGRPFRMKGNFYANIFVHFEPLGLPLNMPEQDAASHDYNMELPPYVIPGSVWEWEYRNSFPVGWTLLKDPIALVIKGDLKTLRYLGQLNPQKLTETDGTSAEWQPIHEAARLGHTDILRFLIEEHNIDVNQMCTVDGGISPLTLAHRYMGADHEASVYLASVGGIKIEPARSTSVDGEEATDEEDHIDHEETFEDEHYGHDGEDWEEEPGEFDEEFHDEYGHEEETEDEL